jgi:hypothetical protein
VNNIYFEIFYKEVEVLKNIITRRFHDSFWMEATDWEFFGEQNRPKGYSIAFNNYKNFKKRCIAFIKKIRKRINDVVTNDILLNELLLGDLKVLEEKVKNISEKNFNEIDIIADLFRIIGHFLGWDCLDGKFYRTPVFYQSKEQEINIYNNRIKNKKPVGLLEGYYRHKIIKQLLADGKSYEKIALIFNISIKSVKSYEKASYLIELYEKK